MKVLILFVALVAFCLADTTPTSVTLKNGITLSADQNGFTASGKVSRSTFSFWIGSMEEKSSGHAVLRNTTYGTAVIGDFSQSTNYWSLTIDVPMSIYDIESELSYEGEISLLINTYTADSFYVWNNANISCPSGALKMIPTIEWTTPSGLSNYLSFSGTVTWDVSDLDIAEALTDGVSYKAVDSDGAQVGAQLGINGGIGIYFTFPGNVLYDEVTYGSMSFNMNSLSPSTSGTADWSVNFGSIATTMTFDPVLQLTGNGAGALVYSFSLIFLVLAVIKFF